MSFDFSRPTDDDDQERNDLTQSLPADGLIISSMAPVDWGRQNADSSLPHHTKYSKIGDKIL